MAEKFYLVSDDSYRLNLFKNEILKNDPQAEVFLETDFCRFWYDFSSLSGNVKILLDHHFDWDEDFEHHESIVSHLEKSEFDHVSGNFDIYLLGDVKMLFKNNVYKHKNSEIHIHYLDSDSFVIKSLVDKIYNGALFGRKILLLEDHEYPFGDKIKKALKSDIYKFPVYEFTDHDVANFDFFTFSSPYDMLIVNDFKSLKSYLFNAVNLGFKGEVICLTQKDYESLKNFTILQKLSLVKDFNFDYLTNNSDYNQNSFVMNSIKYLKFFSENASEEDLADAISRINSFNFSQFPILLQETKYVYKNKKDFTGVVYGDYSYSLEILEKIDNNQISPVEVFEEFKKGADYIHNCMFVPMERIYKNIRRSAKCEKKEFLRALKEFNKLADGIPASLIFDHDICVCYAMLLSVLSIIRK